MFIKKGSQKFTEGSLLKLPYLTSAICLSAFHKAFNFLEQTNISARSILFWPFKMARLKTRLKRKSFATLTTLECIIRVSSRQKSLSYINMMYDAKSLDFSSQGKVFLTAAMSPETNVSLVRVSFLILPSKNVKQIK